jgi:diguanylate cyclase (GGDEF)-like protein/PAS domain S-box-containing protein
MALILVVDDWPINREFLATLLRYAGHEVIEAGDGAAALAQMQTDVPDLLITDILMPVMDGTELARRVAGIPALANVPIIFYTATYRLSEAQTMAAACGVTTVLPKPSAPQQVLDAVHGELGVPMATLSLEEAAGYAGPPEPSPTEGLKLAYLQELGSLKSALQTSVSELGPPLNGEANRLRRVATDVDESFLRAQALSMRLATLIELGIELSQREAPDDLLAVFCRGARDVMSSKYSVVCVLDESARILAVAANGFGAEQEAVLRAKLVPTAGPFGDVLLDGDVRLFTGKRSAAEVGLPPELPAVTSMLVARIASRGRTFGWFFVAERLAGRGFGNDDQHLAGILGAQLATQYENRLLFDQTKRNAGLLAVEIDERRAAADRLRETELRFRQLAENIREVFLLLDAVTGDVLYASPAYADIWQRSVESLRASPRSWLDAVHADDRELAASGYAQSMATGQFDLEYRIVRPDSTLRWIRARGFPIRDERGRLYRVAGIAEDITAPKLQELRIQRLSRMLAVLSGINSTIVRTHERGALLDEACRIGFEEGGFPIVWVAWYGADGITVAASRGLDAVTIAAAEAYLRTSLVREFAPARASLESKQVTVHQDLHTLDSATVGPVTRLALGKGCKSLASLPLLLGNDLVGAMMLYARDEVFDAEELKLLKELAGDVSFALQYIAKEDELNYLAYYDPLTGLANGTLFNERIAQMLDRKPRRAALFVLDIDRFTHLNDSLGRHVGDRLLTGVAQRLAESIPEPTLLSRVGADTFAVGVSSLRNDSEAGTILQERILSALNRPFELDDRELRVSMRAGVAVYPADGANAETLFKNAEAALNGAKETNARFVFYSPQLNARVADDLALEQRLRGALERNEFRVYYQPKVTSRSGELVGLEALLRWQTPDGVVAPDRFIHVLEDSELIIDVGRWVLEQALKDYRSWEERGLRVPRIAVNVSPIQLRYGDFPEMVFATLQAAGLDGKALELEITESVIMADIDASTERLKRLNDFGVTIAIDDFGTGYSSLRYLAKLPVDTLKIDRTFIVRMALEPDSMTLVSTMINLAHAFEMTVVAEGVDSEEQANLLRLMKCDTLQGYLFGKPVPAEEIETLLLG